MHRVLGRGDSGRNRQVRGQTRFEICGLNPGDQEEPQKRCSRVFGRRRQQAKEFPGI